MLVVECLVSSLVFIGGVTVLVCGRACGTVVGVVLSERGEQGSGFWGSS